MNTQPSSGLQTCPDCGGILEQPQSYLASTIAVVSPSLDTLDQEIGAWQCPPVRVPMRAERAHR